MIGISCALCLADVSHEIMLYAGYLTLLIGQPYQLKPFNLHKCIVQFLQYYTVMIVES